MSIPPPSLRPDRAANQQQARPTMRSMKRRRRKVKSTSQNDPCDKLRSEASFGIVRLASGGGQVSHGHGRQLDLVPPKLEKLLGCRRNMQVHQHQRGSCTWLPILLMDPTGAIPGLRQRLSAYYASVSHTRRYWLPQTKRNGHGL